MTIIIFVVRYKRRLAMLILKALIGVALWASFGRQGYTKGGIRSCSFKEKKKKEPLFDKGTRIPFGSSSVASSKIFERTMKANSASFEQRWIASTYSRFLRKNENRRTVIENFVAGKRIWAGFWTNKIILNVKLLLQKWNQTELYLCFNNFDNFQNGRTHIF